MTLSASLVGVKKISSSIPRSHFDSNKLEEIARAILEAEGVINPIILRRTGLTSFEVVNGHLEFYAAVRAREIDPLKGESIEAFVIDPDKEKALEKQIEILRGLGNPETTNTSTSPEDETRLEQRLTQIETTLNQYFSNLSVDLTKMQQELKRQSEQVLAKPVESQASTCSLLAAFNATDQAALADKFKSARINKKTSTKILESIASARQVKEFESLADVVDRVKGLGIKTFALIVENWYE